MSTVDQVLSLKRKKPQQVSAKALPVAKKQKQVEQKTSKVEEESYVSASAECVSVASNRRSREQGHRPRHASVAFPLHFRCTRLSMNRNECGPARDLE